MNFSRDLYAQLVHVTLPTLGFDTDAVRAPRVIWLRHAPHRFLVPYGDWFVGLRLMPFAEARDRTESGVRCIFSPITRVGVFCVANLRSWRSCAGVQGLLWFFGAFAMTCAPPESACADRQRGPTPP